MPTLRSLFAIQKQIGLEDYVKRADVLVAAIGKANFVKGEWLKPGAIVIDVGTNFILDETKKSGQRLVGDVDFASASEVASQITPVPVELSNDCCHAFDKMWLIQLQPILKNRNARSIQPLPLKLLNPVPTDIAISRAQRPKQITVLHKEIGIAGHELEPYGAYKAKVDLSLLKRLEHRRNGKYVVVTGITHTTRGGKIHYYYGYHTGHCWSLEPYCLRQCTPAQSRTNLWYQRRCCRWRLQSGYSYGRIQSPLDW